MKVIIGIAIKRKTRKAIIAIPLVVAFRMLQRVSGLVESTSSCIQK
jgi:hypothetical protein